MRGQLEKLLRMQKVAPNTRSCQKVAEQLVESANQAPPSTGVTVIGNPRVLGIPISKILVIWASPSHITLAICVRATGNANITMVCGMGMPKTQECPYHCDTGATIYSSTFLGIPA